MSGLPRSWARGAWWTATSSVLVGALGLLAVASAARGLGTDDYGAFAYTWAVFFGVGGIFAGLQSEVTRSLSQPQSDQLGPSMLLVTVAFSVPVALVGGLAVVLGVGGVTESAAGVATSMGLLMLAGLTLGSGVLAVDRRWGGLAALMSADAVLRAAAVVIVTSWGAVAGLPWAIASGGTTWLMLFLFRETRQSLSRVVLSRPSGLPRRLLLAMVAAGCTSLVVSGLPALLGLVRLHPIGPDVAGLIAALVLVRSGLLVAVYGARPMVLRYFLSHSLGSAEIVRVGVACLAAGLAYAAAAALVGPSLLGLLLGPGFVPSRAEVWWLGFGAAGLVAMVVVGLALLARDQHLAAMAGWITALAASVVCLRSASSAGSAVLLAAAGAPWAGAAVHLLLAAGVRRRTGGLVEAERESGL